MTTLSVPSTARHKPLATCIAALFALVAPEAFAATWIVNSCADSGSNTLRDVVTNFAQSGDTVDLSQLSCSTISLTTGAITMTQNDLALQGPPTREVITGYYNGATENDRIFKHTGTGTLSLQYLDIEYSSLAPTSGLANGGCIYSKGNVFLSHALVLGCVTNAPAGQAGYGGGIYTKGNLIAKYSQIAGNTASGGVGGTGGGAYVGGTFTAVNSTINGNSATNHGGISAHKGASILNSTLSGNTAILIGGMLVDGGSTDSLLISNSTISGNTAQGDSTFSIVGGIRSTVPTTVQNSTIAFNTATAGQGAFSAPYAPGLAMVPGAAASTTVNLQSSILSNNTYGTTEVDFSTVGTGIAITSANSLIRASLGPQRPATVSTACPLLGPLRDNGGPTQTHALMSRSPAIDAGNNAAGLVADQRGSAYPRVSGPAADIGAYELQQNDIIFNSGFEGCPMLF